MNDPWIELTVPVLFKMIAVVTPVAILLVLTGEYAARWYRRRKNRERPE